MSLLLKYINKLLPFLFFKPFFYSYECQYDVNSLIYSNFQVLVISPQNLGEDVLLLIGQTKLKHLHILQNRFTPSELVLLPVSGKAWYSCRKANPSLSVHLEVESQRERDIIWQERAPVRSIIYDSPLAKVTYVVSNSDLCYFFLLAGIILYCIYDWFLGSIRISNDSNRSLCSRSTSFWPSWTPPFLSLQIIS